MKILVLQGGDSGEREVSFRSAKSVSEALSANGHKVYKYDPSDGFEGLKKYAGMVDVVFPILHGAGGEDGVIQAELGKLGFKYLGAGSKVSKTCFDKVEFKKAAEKLGILMPPDEIVDQKSFYQSKLIKSPFVLKPIDGGSSIDTFIVRDTSKLPADIDKTLKKYKSMLLEELIMGDEITVPILDGKALPAIEIIPPISGEFDYENKYNGKTQELCPPKNVSEKSQKQAQKIAEKLHNGLGVRHISRTDFIVTKSEEIYTLELNTIPGMTDQSLFPKSAKAGGISMEQLVEKFVGLVLK
jgi:D-alanine-D-alanine ligase